ncbi:hypothetical protein BCR33DRAFT_721441 [Rhizoclosmatium globosum]|uniref:RING-type domain-containing protein n=1 Tax=Rhizoclosmatium globosum TaxID=329046 RepID=A0A1Y2BRM3_9FUNG|nr:hypothetical protein BCR33DRAFT_721441 [Rhizoclosmatium globosum]|eukprot:ORY37399.1 hypothetical protein BCR33DRAFT_721441 [Rhizoclosmatium globosum]
MDSIDRSTWRYVNSSADKDKDIDELLDTLDLRCTICTDGFISPATLPGCGHTFCSSCLSVWISNSNTCPLDRRALGPAEHPQPARAIQDTLNWLNIECECGFEGILKDHSNCCPLLKCDWLNCNYFATERTAWFQHKKQCPHRETFCSTCFPTHLDPLLPPSTELLAHRRECILETPLLEWSPTLSFGSQPGRVFREVHRYSADMLQYRHLPEADRPTIVYSGMQIAQEITSFQCRYFFHSYRHCQHLFHPSLNLPHYAFCSENSYVCFLFEENMGLRLVSIRLWPRHYQLQKRLDDAVRAFSQQADIPETEPVSFKVSERRPETVVVVGRNHEEGGENEINIEFIDRRFPPAGGPRAHNQLLEFVGL